MALRTWNGGHASSNNWTEAANWGGTAPVAGDDLAFGGTTRLTPYNNFTADTSFNSITFNSGAGAFTLSGNRITLGGDITQNDDSLQTIDLAMIINSRRTINLVSGNLTINGIISGTDGIDHEGTYTLTLTADNTFLGYIWTLAGTLSVAKITNKGIACPLGAQTTDYEATIWLGAGSSTAILKYTGTGHTHDRPVDLYGTTGGAKIRQSGSGLLKFTANFIVDTDGAKILTLEGSGNGEISGVIPDSGSGAISIEKGDGGTWSLTGLNTYTGTTLVYSGTLEFNTIKNVSGGSSSLGAPTTVSAGTIELQGFDPILKYIGTGDVTDRVINFNTTTVGKIFVIEQAGASGTLEFTSTPIGQSGTKTLILKGSTAGLGLFSGVIANIGGSALSIQKDGTGTWKFSAANTYTGTTVINGGIFQVGNAGTTGSLSTSSAITVTSPGSLDFNRTDTVTQGTNFNSVIGGTGKVRQVGSATLVLNGVNTFQGGVDIIGSVSIVIASISNSALGTGTVTINGGRRLVVSDGLSVTNNIIINSNSGQGSRGILENSDTGTATISGTITINNTPASGGHFAGYSTGILILSGAITSASVAVSFRTGIVVVSGGGSYSTITHNAGTIRLGTNNGLATGATVNMSVSASSNLDLNGYTQSLVGITKSANAATIGNSSTVSNSTLTITGSPTWAGVTADVLGSGNKKVNIVINSAGTVTFSGTNTYTGTTTVNAGTLKAGSIQAFGVNSAVTMANIASAILEITGFNNSIGSLVGGGITGGNIVLGSAILTIGGNNTSPGIYAGIISGIGGSLVKTGTGILRLSGNNTFTGGIAHNSGTLTPDHNNAFGTGSIAFASGAILKSSSGLTYTLSNAFVLTGTSIIQVPAGAGDFILVGVISGAGTLKITSDVGGGRVELSGNNSYGGGTILGESTNNTRLMLGHTSALGSGTLTVDQSGIDQGLEVTSPLTIANTIVINTGKVLVIAKNASPNATLSGIISGNGSIQKESTGTWTLSGVNTYTGTTKVNKGILKAGSLQAFGIGSAVTIVNSGSTSLDITGFSNTIGSLTGGGVTGGNVILGYATLTIGSDGTSPSAYAGIVSGNGEITKIGAGILILSGLNTYTGITTVSAGILRAGSTQAFGIGSAVIIANVAGAILDPDVFDITIKSLAGGGVLGGVVDLTEDVTLTINGNGTDTTFNGNLIGIVGSVEAKLIKEGTGKLTLGGTNSYQEETIVNDGELVINGFQHDNDEIFVNSGAKISGSGEIAGELWINAGAILNPIGVFKIATNIQSQLVLAPTAKMQFTLGTSSDKIIDVSELTLDGVVDVTAGAGFASRSYDLILYNGPFINNGLTIGLFPVGFVGMINTSETGKVKLLVYGQKGKNNLVGNLDGNLKGGFQ